MSWDKEQASRCLYFLLLGTHQSLHANIIPAAEPSGLKMAKWCIRSRASTISHSKGDNSPVRRLRPEGEKSELTQSKCYGGKKAFPLRLSEQTEKSCWYEILNQLGEYLWGKSFFYWNFASRYISAWWTKFDYFHMILFTLAENILKCPLY